MAETSSDGAVVATQKTEYVSVQAAGKLGYPERLQHALSHKQRGNEHYGAQRTEAAMQCYLGAIWLLKPGRPPYPNVLNSQQPPRGEAASSLLGSGRSLAAETSDEASQSCRAPSKVSQPVEAVTVNSSTLTPVCAEAGAGIAVAVLLVVAHSGMGSLDWRLRILLLVLAVAAMTFAFLRIVNWLSPENPPTAPLRNSLRIEQKRRSMYVPETATPASVCANDDDLMEGKEASQLRLSLHLNVALCALKRSDFRLAREACKFVLSLEPNHQKALYRFAQACEAESDLAPAVTALRKMLQTASPQDDTRDARKLLAGLKERQASEKAMFRGVCEKDGFHSPETAPAPAPVEKEDPLTERIRLVLEYEAREEARKAEEAAQKAAAAKTAMAAAASSAAASADD
uniref:Peptidylprolyl isomerase n=1 Tax=Chrysotila carterae TaxID=13221 RepID=A0A7S4B439_CHRCT|mmetsp:Transcript_29989/g.63231  ORF Transcript_29989/g.63231 Transcript_29989/m.63231 type:complete len:401 (+) Transcript_29989:219-1421(+)